MRSRRWRIATATGVLALGIALAFGLRPAHAPGAGHPPAPELAARTLDGTSRVKTLADYRGQVVLLNVWATWCDPCREEMPSMERLHRAFVSHGLRIVAVSIDDAGSEELITDFAREHGLTFELLHDAKADVMRRFSVRGVPQSFLISRTGELRGTKFVTDWFSPANQALVNQLLAEPGA